MPVNRINIAFPFNDIGTTPVNVFATGNRFTPTTVANVNGNGPGSLLSGSLTKAGKQFRSSLNQISERLNDSVQNALSGFCKRIKTVSPKPAATAYYIRTR